MLVLRDYQTEALNAWINAGYRGSIIHATGLGKTEIAIAAHEHLSKNVSPNTKTLFACPRINLVDQTVTRFRNNGFNATPYYGRMKDLSGDIVVITIQSLYDRLELIERFNFFVFDEVHLMSTQAEQYHKALSRATYDSSHAILALTATIDVEQEKNVDTIKLCPIVHKMNVQQGIDGGFLARVRLFDESVYLEDSNWELYNECTETIRKCSAEMHTHDPIIIAGYLKHGSPELRACAGAWFKAVRTRIYIQNTDTEKLLRVGELMSKIEGKTLVYAERTQALYVLKKLFKEKFEYIVARTPQDSRDVILKNWGTTFNFLGTVHTLDIGFDAPDCINAVVLASNMNPNSITQRIGRIIRVHESKPQANIYVVYARGTTERRVYIAMHNVISKQYEQWHQY